MSFDIIRDYELQENATHVEINSTVNKNLRESRPNENVEIFSKIIFGKDVSKYGKKVDTVFNAVRELASAADNGDNKAKAEINSIVTITLQQPLMQRLKLLGFMGQNKTVGYNDQLNVEYYQLQASDLARIQATSGAFTFPTVKKITKSVETQNATAGMKVDYRELASGATDGMAFASEQVITSLTNQVISSHMNALREGIQNATTLKNYASGITQTAVDEVRKKARRFGAVTIMGDIAAVEKLNDFTGFNINSATATEVRYPDAVMEEILRTGLISTYKGSTVIEIPNTYDQTKLNSDGTYYGLTLPTTDLWFVPQGQLTPLLTVNRGGLTTMTATDINTRSEVTRWDLEFGNYVIPEYIPFIGYIYDESLAD